ncbi:MAG: hypothetical protein ACP5HS_02140, partial [Anaerolineae bacterium]
EAEEVAAEAEPEEPQPEAEETTEEIEEEEPVYEFTEPEGLAELVGDLDEIVYEDEEEVELGDRSPTQKRRKGRKQRRRTIVYDDATGETFVVRKRRRGQDAWDEYGEDY